MHFSYPRLFPATPGMARQSNFGEEAPAASTLLGVKAQVTDNSRQLSGLDFVKLML